MMAEPMNVSSLNKCSDSPRYQKHFLEKAAEAKTQANQAKSAPITVSKQNATPVTVVREGRSRRGGSYISADIVEDSGAVHRIFSGSNGSSFADNGPLPPVKSGGEGCGSGNCNPVKFIGRREGKYYWKDRAEKYYYSTTYPKPGECFQAVPTGRPR